MITLTPPTFFKEKENLYLEVRRREGRVLSDDAVRKLPNPAGPKIYAREWAWRRRSFERFRRYLQKTNPGPLRILDLGCGNGWMANRLAEHPQWQVWAIDVNEEELQQGARLFARKNLHFAYADVLQTDLAVHTGGLFDVVILAAAVQYFPDLPALVPQLKSLLQPRGTIHFLDSPFYKNEAARTAARQRSLDYYTKLGVPAMAPFYHHHLWKEVQCLGGVDLNASLKTKALQKAKWLAPFPWVKI